VVSKEIGNLIIQSLLIETENENISSNTTTSELDALSNAISKIKPNKVQIYTLVRKAAVPGIHPTDKDKMYNLKKLIDSKCGNHTITDVY